MKTILNKEILDEPKEALDPEHTAVVIIDMQNDLAHPDGHHARHGFDVSAITAVVPKISELVNAARACGVMRIWIRQTALPGGLNDSPAWLAFKSKIGYFSEFVVDGTWGHSLIDPLAPMPDELIVDKNRSDAYIGTRLDLVLRSNDIHTVVHCGCVTEGCVESTVRSSQHHDYYPYVAGDCVASISLDRHQASLAIMAHRYNVMTSHEIVEIWRDLGVARE